MPIRLAAGLTKPPGPDTNLRFIPVFYSVMPKPNLLFITRPLLVVVMIVAASACQNDMQTILKLQNEKKEPLLTTRNLDMIYTDSGKLEARVRAPLMLSFSEEESPYTEFPEGIHVEVFDQDTLVRGEITAKYAIYHEKQKLWEGRGDVVGINKLGDRINTEQLFWDEQNQKIYTHTVARITKVNKGVIIGENGLESYLEEGDFTLFSLYNSKGDIAANMSAMARGGSDSLQMASDTIRATEPEPDSVPSLSPPQRSGYRRLASPDTTAFPR